MQKIEVNDSSFGKEALISADIFRKITEIEEKIARVEDGGRKVSNERVRIFSILNICKKNKQVEIISSLPSSSLLLPPPSSLFPPPSSLPHSSSSNPPPPVNSRDDLLKQIQGGVKLRKVGDEDPKEGGMLPVKISNITPLMEQSLTMTLAQAIAERRKQITKNDYTSDEASPWSDDD